MQEPVMLTTVRRTINSKEYKYRGAQESDYSTLITQPTVVFDTEQDKVTVVYLELDDDFTEVVAALQQISYQADGRSEGLVSRSRSIGYLPRNPLRRDFCTTSGLGYEHQDAHAIVAKYAREVATYYERYNPTLYEKHKQQVHEVLPDWRLEESVFTSGIINKDTALLYHFDTGNFKGVWSNMLVFKHRMHGGYLAVPEYDIGFELKNNSLLMFDGQSLMHGVTPIMLQGKQSYRYSVVFYSLQQMWHCLPVGEEIRRVQKLRTMREEKRLARNLKGVPLESTHRKKKST